MDAMAEPQSLENVGLEWGFDGRNMHAHQGILRRAEWIRRYVVHAVHRGRLMPPPPPCFFGGAKVCVVCNVLKYTSDLSALSGSQHVAI